MADGFPDTRWTLVQRVREPAGIRRKALSELCEIYWPPLYSYARLRGASSHDAEDLTQGFLARLLERDALANLRPRSAKLRSFLLTSFANYMTEEYRKENRKKRGGEFVRLSLDWQAVERSFADSPSDTLTPEAQFDRQWAKALIQSALDQLESKYASQGKEDWYRKLVAFLDDAEEQPKYATLAEQLGKSESSIKSAVFRIRREFQELMRSQIAETIADGENPEEELRYLIGLFS
jgi:RNA polymerase sigma factor (sigma-70 family)